jgi:hypothetical protein
MAITKDPTSRSEAFFKNDTGFAWSYGTPSEIYARTTARSVRGSKARTFPISSSPVERITE